MDITRGQAYIKFEELCKKNIRLLFRSYFDNKEFKQIIIKNELGMIENAIKQTVIDCFEDNTLRKSQMEIINNRLNSHLPKKYHYIYRDRFLCSTSSEKFMVDFIDSIRECTCKIMRKLYEYIRDNNVDHILYDPNIFTDCELFD